MPREAFIGQLALFPYSRVPQGWISCNGQELPLSGAYLPLFGLIGTVYGGDGVNNFCLPNLQGRVPMHIGNGYQLGDVGGRADHELTAKEMPQHGHTLLASNDQANTKVATDQFFAGFFGWYGTKEPLVTLSPQVVSPAGYSHAHENRQPYAVLSYCIAYAGILPVKPQNS